MGIDIIIVNFTALPSKVSGRGEDYVIGPEEMMCFAG